MELQAADRAGLAQASKRTMTPQDRGSLQRKLGQHIVRATRTLVCGTILVLIAVQVLVAAPAAAEPDWMSLLDPELSQWETYLSFRHTSSYDGTQPMGPDGEPLQPIGYNRDVADVFTVILEEGAPVLRISGEIYGAVFTKAEFHDYHLRLRVRWGQRKWEPRTDKLRDSGVLYHSRGDSGVDWWRSWKLSQEFQVMEGHMGDYWSIAGSAVEIRAFIPEGDMNPVASRRQPFIAIGAGAEYGGFCLRSEDRESPPGEWTQLELITFGDKSLHIVNGTVVMVLRGSRYHSGDESVPLTRGKIQLQSEGAEVFYRDVEIRSIEALPVEYAGYFN